MKKCRNCGGIFTHDQLDKQKPPMHPHQLTKTGHAQQFENEISGNATRCPDCGNATLVVA